MNKDQIKGTTKDLVGKVQEEAGKLIGSKEQQAKGLDKQISGKAQKAIGDVFALLDRPLRDAEPAQSFRRSDRQPNAQSASARIRSPAGVPTGMATAPGGIRSTPGAATGTPVP